MIHTRGLARRFRAKSETVEAVRGIDLDVSEGELVAFLGPNGAGKSTTLRMLTTLLRPTAGTATVAGHDVAAEPAAVRSNIGYIGQGNGAGHAHRVLDELVNQGRFYGMPRREARTRAHELLDAMNLDGLRKRGVTTLSGGQRRRLDIALGLMHHPKLLFLDEPSTGLDPQNRVNLAERIRALRFEFSVTVFLTTHYLDEADALAERVVIIDDGRVIASGTPARLKADLAGDRIALSSSDPEAAGRAAVVAEKFESVRDVARDGAALTLTVDDGEAVLPRLLRRLDSDGIAVERASVRVPTLDDVFLALTGRSLREADK